MTAVNRGYLDPQNNPLPIPVLQAAKRIVRPTAYWAIFPWDSSELILVTPPAAVPIGFILDSTDVPWLWRSKPQSFYWKFIPEDPWSIGSGAVAPGVLLVDNEIPRPRYIRPSTYYWKFIPDDPAWVVPPPPAGFGFLQESPHLIQKLVW